MRTGCSQSASNPKLFSNSSSPALPMGASCTGLGCQGCACPRNWSPPWGSGEGEAPAQERGRAEISVTKCPQMFENQPGIRSVERRAHRGSGCVSSTQRAAPQLCPLTAAGLCRAYFRGYLLEGPCLCHPRRALPGWLAVNSSLDFISSISCPSGIESQTLVGWKRP